MSEMSGATELHGDPVIGTNYQEATVTTGSECG